MIATLPASLLEAIVALGLGEVVDATFLGGNALRVQLNSGDLLFAKCAGLSATASGSVPANLYPSEHRGLDAIAATRTIATPTVLASSADYLLLEWLDGQRGSDYWSTLGEQLASLHACSADTFGFAEDNYCGMTTQPNPRLRSGYDFFADARLRHQARLAVDAAYLDAKDNARLELIIHKLPGWIPGQPPALIHGDLWGGNIACTQSGQPALIDPAAHYGWHEAELAMTLLFGGFDPAFYAAYESCSACDEGWRERAPLYNLYHLLNHLNLFGARYLAAVRKVLERYGGSSAS